MGQPWDRAGASQIFSSNSPLVIGTFSSENLTLGTANASRITINSSGNVGIGTTSPGDKLHIFTAAHNGLRIQASTDSLDPTIQIGRSTTDNFKLQVRGTSGAARLSIWDATNGAVDQGLNLMGNNLGIGTTSPGAKLDINSGGTTKMLLGANTSNTNYNAISLNGDNTDNARIGMTGGGSADGRLYLDAVTNITFRPGSSATQAMTILSGGNVGIGTTNPGAKLDVSGGGITISICPSGMEKISDGLCMDSSRRTATRCDNAMKVCHAEGKHVCTYGEHYIAWTTVGRRLENGDWIGNYIGDDQCLCCNSTSDVNNFDGGCSRNDNKLYRCCINHAGGGI